MDGFNGGGNDFIFGERLKEAKGEAKVIIEILVIEWWLGLVRSQCKESGF